MLFFRAAATNDKIHFKNQNFIIDCLSHSDLSDYATCPVGE